MYSRIFATSVGVTGFGTALPTVLSIQDSVFK